MILCLSLKYIIQVGLRSKVQRFMLEDLLFEGVVPHILFTILVLVFGCSEAGVEEQGCFLIFIWEVDLLVKLEKEFRLLVYGYLKVNGCTLIP